MRRNRKGIGRGRLRVCESLEPRAYLASVYFSSPAFYPLPSQGYSNCVTVADVNGDGKADLVVGNRTANNTGTISVFLGNGDGTFKPRVDSILGAAPTNIAVADMNGDGKADVIVAERFPTGAISIALGNGDGTFGLRRDFPVSAILRTLVVSDINGDGKPDVLTSSQYSGSGEVRVLLGNGNGTLRPETDFPVAAYGPFFVVVGDINGDGKLDVVAAGSDTAASFNPTFSVLLGNGDGTFRSSIDTPLSTAPSGLGVGDLNGDGKPDLVIGTNGSVSVLLGNGNGSFQSPVPFGSGSSQNGLALADVNGDGKPDVITSAGGAGVQSKPSVGVLLGVGNGAVQPSIDIPIGQTNPGSIYYADSFIARDVNGDGKPDLIVLPNPNTGKVTVLLNASGAAPTVTMVGTTVVGTGSAVNDAASVSTDGTNVTVAIGTVTKSFPLASVTSLNLSLGGGNDSLTVAAGVPPVTVSGGAGADTINAANSGDMIVGGKGKDLLIASGANTTLSGGKGADTLSGSGSGQVLLGGKGADVLLNGGTTASRVDGGPGLNVAQTEGSDTVTNVFEVLYPAAAPHAVAALLPPARLDAAGVTATTVLSASGLELLKVRGTAGADAIAVAPDPLDPLDLLVTRSGSPVGSFPIAALAGGIVLIGGAGNDTLQVSTAIVLPATLRGGAGDDLLLGGGGSSVLIGGAGNDTLRGRGGANYLIPGPGPSAGDNAVVGDDKLVGSTLPGSASYAFFNHRTDDLSLSNDGTNGSGDAALNEHVTIEGGVQNIFAGNGRDTVVSTVAGSLLTAGTGQDSLASGGIGTTLAAGMPGSGADTLRAGGGFNVLLLMNGHADEYGGTVGSDVLSMDSGLDTSGA